MPIKILNGGKTFPKRGRLGSGAYWPSGVPIRGNPFGPNTALRVASPIPTPRAFGTPTNVGNNTQVGQNRVTTGATAVHPNRGFHSNANQNKVPPIAIYQGNGNFRMSYPTDPNPVIQPHERNRLASKKLFGVHRAAFGVNDALPSDTAFHRVHPQQSAIPAVHPQTYTLQKTRAGGLASFRSQNNLWSDPNNSFLQNKTNINGDVGRGRWHTVKRGAAG